MWLDEFGEKGVVVPRDNENKKSNGLGIAKLAVAHDRQLAATAQLAKQMQQLNPTLSMFSKLQQNSGLSALMRTMDTTGIAALQRAMDNSGVGALSKAMQGLDLGANSAFANLTRGLDLDRLNAATRLAIDTDAFHGTAFSKLTRAIDANLFPSALRTIEIPGLKNMLSAIDTGSFGTAIAQANRNYALGLPKTFGAELQTAVGGLNQQMKAIADLGLTQKRMFEGLQFASLETLLAQSIEVQEAILEEQQQAKADAQEAAKFQTRLNVISAVITIIMFMITIVNTIDDWTTDEDAALKGNTIAIEEMQGALAAMADEIEELRAAQAEEAQREADADEEIADILRGIATALETDEGYPEQPAKK